MSDSTNIRHPQDQLLQLISRWIAPLGYRVIHLELQTHRQTVLRVYIDFLKASADQTIGTIGIEDCVRVTKALDEPLDQSPEVGNLLPSTYELEVSSPGLNRPLRNLDDFKQFSEHRIRVHTFRSLSKEELNNDLYFTKNPKQKNFIGILKGIRESNVLLSISLLTDKEGKQSEKRKASSKAKHLLEPQQEESMLISLPFPLISKANLEPEISIEAKNDRE